MKGLVTILFLLLMACQVMVDVHLVQDEIQLVQDVQEEGETEGKDEKVEEKAYPPQPLPVNAGAIAHLSKFPIRFIPLQASPVLENQTPPPDPA